MASTHPKPLPHLFPIDIERFWSKIDKRGPEECWTRKASLNNKGYGIIGIKNSNYLATRISYLLHHGSDPGRSLVLHHCDNPPCVNGAHLWLGSQSDNIQDMLLKGRDSVVGDKHWSRIHPDRIQRGSRHGGHKLVESQVVEIRRRLACGERRPALAREFGVVVALIDQIAWRTIWKHI